MKFSALLLAISSFGAFLVSLLSVAPPGLNLFWKLSIPVKETGFILSPFLAAAAWAAWTAGRRGVWGRLSSMGLAGAAVLFAWPLAATLRALPGMERDFARVFGPLDERAALRHAPVQWADFARGVEIRPAPAPRVETYARKDGVDLRLDFHPAGGEARGGKPGAAPCVVVIHGGGWDTGTRGQFREASRWLAGAGYAVASIDYRLAPAHPYPAALEDARDALAWLRAHAGRLGIAPDRFVLLGRSAGGQIALQAAYAWNDAGVRGVVAFYAPADMVFGYHVPSSPLILDSRKVMDQYLNGGCRESDAPCRAASPLESVHRDAPPTLLLHGRADVMVSPLHTTHLAAKLERLGVRHAVVELPWATHGHDFILRGTGSQVGLYFVERFLARVTGPG